MAKSTAPGRMPRWDRSKGRPEPVALLDRIPLVECGEPLVSLRDVAPSVRIQRPQAIPYVRQRVAEMAEQAARLLPSGIYLGVTDAWRPLRRQQLIYEFMTAAARVAFPERSSASLRRTVNRWVAPPGRKAPPGHCTGAALDVVLTDAQGDPLDLTSPFDRLRGAPTHVYGLTEEAARNRRLLYEAMIHAGFSNCRDEWWHYSYGDAGWAVRTGAATCIYGLIELDERLYQEQQAEWEVMHAQRPNPFLPA